MSFQFQWPSFSPHFYKDAIQTLDNVRLALESMLHRLKLTTRQALNKGQKPAIIADRINVKELNMGTLVSLHITC